MRSRPALAGLLVVLAAVLPYLPTLGDYFVQDDFGVVALLSQKPATSFPRWFVSTWMDDIWGYTPDEIRPFPAVSYQITSLFGAGSPVAHHVLNVALHALNARLVLAIAQAAFGLSIGPATFAALVFAVLPMQTESVAWVTGRVDSMPALFYLAGFLAFVRWRAGAGRAAYAWAVVWCFVALFTKQNAVTLVAALVAYDVIVGRRRPRASWGDLSPYLPFVVLTAGYLALRYALFGEVAREGTLTAERVGFFLQDLSVHLRRMVFGEPGLGLAPWRAAAVLALATAVAAAAAWRSGRAPALARPVLFVAVAWLGLAVAPTLVAGYASPRHVYLASTAWAWLLGAALEAAWHLRPQPWARRVALAIAVVLVGAYATLLVADVLRWGDRAAVSRRAVEDITREALAAPLGTLIVAGAPRSSWDFALPHALRPPFVAEDLTGRVSVISHSSLHCCPANRWEPYTRDLLRAWAADPARPPVIALHWDASTGRRSRVSDADDPFLRSMATWLIDAEDVAALDRGLLAITDRFATMPR